MKAPVIAARYSDDATLPEKVNIAVRIQQNNDVAVRYGVASARLIERVIGGSTIPDALAWAADGDNLGDAEIAAQIKEVQETREGDTTAAVARYGWTCRLPGSFLGAIHCLAKYDTFEAAMTANVLAGGDQCSRGALIGGMFGASLGLAGLPHALTSKVTAFERIVGLSRELVAFRA